MKQFLHNPADMLPGVMIICLLALAAGLAAARVSSAQQIDGILHALQQESTPDTVQQREEAVLRIGRSEAVRRNQAVQVALIEAVDRANAEYLASIRNSDPYDERQGELLLALIRTLIQLDDARSIPVLIRTAHTGRRVQEALARFGEDAVLPILSAWDGRPVGERTGSLSFRWSGLLDTMALIAADDSLGVSRRSVVRVALDALSKPDNAFVLSSAMALAVSLQDDELLELVRALARQPEEVRRRGIESPRQVELVMRLARQYLGSVRR